MIFTLERGFLSCYNILGMENKYLLNEADLEITIKVLKENSIEIVNKESGKDGFPFLLTPIEKGNRVLLTLDKEADSLFKEINKRREIYLEKAKAADKHFEKGNIKALVSTLLIILAIGIGFFAVGLGMKQHSGYYALLVLAVGVLAFAFYLIHLGTKDYALGRERKRNAKELLK